MANIAYEEREIGKPQGTRIQLTNTDSGRISTLDICAKRWDTLKYDKENEKFRKEQREDPADENSLNKNHGEIKFSKMKCASIVNGERDTMNRNTDGGETRDLKKRKNDVRIKREASFRHREESRGNGDARETSQKTKERRRRSEVSIEKERS